VGRLHVVVAADVLLIDENVGDSSLAGQGQQGVLDGRPVVHVVQFVNLGLHAEFGKKGLGTLAVGAVRFAIICIIKMRCQNWSDGLDVEIPTP
jgi:hypothetical protein